MNPYITEFHQVTDINNKSGFTHATGISLIVILYSKITRVVEIITVTVIDTL